MREPKTRDCVFGLIATTAVFGFYSYFVRELLISLALFSTAFFVLALATLIAIFVWWASEQAAIWTGPASRNLLAFSRRLITPYDKR